MDLSFFTFDSMSDLSLFIFSMLQFHDIHKQFLAGTTGPSSACPRLSYISVRSAFVPMVSDPHPSYPHSYKCGPIVAHLTQTQI
jgi:hypothetical protein